MTLKPKLNYPNGSFQKNQDWKKHVKFGQMWEFCSLFSSIAVAWCIMNSCHNVVPSIRNTTLELWVKFGQMWEFCSLFSSIEMAWCIMNSCHNVVLSIRNTTLELWADYAKQFVGNAQNCGETSHGFCTMIRHQPYRSDACAWVFGQKTKNKCLNHRIHRP